MRDRDVIAVAVIDGMGGGIGAEVLGRLKSEKLSGVSLIALGTNAIATQRMISAGAGRGATGENAIRVSVAEVDYIMGPIGIVFANAMMGEISPAIAEAVLASPARKLLLPLSQPHVTIVGIRADNVTDLIGHAVAELVRSIEKRSS